MVDHLVAMGIVSAPEYIERRSSCRGSWMHYPNVGRGKPMTVHFVVRALHSPASVEAMLTLEQQMYGDVVRVDVPWNETRLRGPVLSVAAWFTYAVRHLSSARFIAKLDDDAYVRSPHVEALLRSVLRSTPTPERVYLGAMSWFHWYPKIFERSGFGWSYTMSWMLGRHCRNLTSSEERCLNKGCGACVGPFPFASGFLSLLSTPLVADLLETAVDHSGSVLVGDGMSTSVPRTAASAAPSPLGSNSAGDSTPSVNRVLHDDLSRLRAVRGILPTRTGGRQVKVMEDIWIGSLLFRQPPARPVTYVALSEKDDKTLVSDGWGLRVTRSSVLVHSKNHQRGKQLERFLRIHEFLSQVRCREALEVTCSSGCRAFLTSGERQNTETSETFAEVWGGRIDRASFCTGAQAKSAYCRVGATKPRRCRPKPEDLLKIDGEWPTLMAEQTADRCTTSICTQYYGLLNATAPLQRLADSLLPG